MFGCMYVRALKALGVGVLSFLQPGSGQLRMGEWRTAVIHFLVSRGAVAFYFAYLFYAVNSSNALIRAMFTGLLIILVFSLYSVAGAVRLSWRSVSGTGSWYQRWYAIVAVILLGALVNEGTMLALPKRLESFNIPSVAGMPAVRPGDYLLADNRWIQSRELQRGDMFILYRESDLNQAFVKRVVGLPGDTVQLRSGVLHLNGVAVALEKIGEFELDRASGPSTANLLREILPDGRSYLILDSEPDGPSDNTRALEVPDNFVFVLGDHRDNSFDSRRSSFGLVPLENLYARAIHVYWADDLGRIGMIE